MWIYHMEIWQLYTRGVFYKTNKEKVVECYVDADFVGGWAQLDAENAENDMFHMW